MSKISKEPQKVLDIAHPVPMLSDNLAEFIIKQLREIHYDILVEYGTGNSTRFFLKQLLQLKKKCLFISVEYNYFWFMETVKAVKTDLEFTSTFEEKLQLDHWTYSKCKRYLYGKNGTSLDVPEDLRRLPAAQRALGGPLNIKMLLYRLKENSRPRDGCYSIAVGDSVQFLAFLRSEFMKDQYGESPVKKEYIDAALDSIRRKLPLARKITAAFLIDGGPRGDIVNSILDLEDQHRDFSPTIFLCEAHRLYYADSISRRPSGVFLKGSNRTLNGEPVYGKDVIGKKAEFTYGKAIASPDELAEREVWFYQSSQGYAD